MLSYTFNYNPVTHIATAVGDSATDELVISPVGGLLAHSVNGSLFDTDWNGSNVPAAVTETVDVTLTSGDGSRFKLGGQSGPFAADPASSVFAAISLTIPANTISSSIIDDTEGTTASAATYNVDLASTFSVTGPGINYSEPLGIFQGGVTVQGSAADGDIYNVKSTFTNEPVTVQTAGGVTSTVNVGTGGTLGNIFSQVSVFGGPTTINIDDSADTTSSTATFDNLSSDPNAPFEVTGLSAAPIAYGSGVTDVNVNGGTSGAAGVTYNINNTQSGTTTKVNGGANQNFFNLSNAAQAGGLDNLLGPVFVHGGMTFSDVVTLDDSSANFNDNYTITDTAVSRGGPFGGLTYDSTLGTLTLLAENTLGTNGNNQINIDSTANFVTTNINGQGGVDTINVNNTGFFGVLNVTTGSDGGSTVNVIANNQPVNITSNALATVNIGSTGGPGSMAGIQGPIAISNPPSLTDLNFHDENDAAGQTWTLDNDDGAGTGSVAVTGSATTSYDPFDIASITINGGSGGNTFNVNQTSSFFPTALFTGFGNDTTNVFATGSNDLDIHGEAGQDSVTLGADPVVGMQNLLGTIDVDNILGFTALVLDDSADTSSQFADLSNDGTNGQVTGLSPATISYSNNSINSLVVSGGSGGNNFTVDGTAANIFVAPVVTTLNTGFGDDSVTVSATSAGGPLDIHGQAGDDNVTISDFGSVADILGDVTVDNDFGFTTIAVDATFDNVSHTIGLSSDGTKGTLTGLAPANIVYTIGDTESLTLDTNAASDQVLNLDMSGGNPIPFASPTGLVFNAGADFGNLLGSHTLNIFGALPTGPFASETHNANDHGVFPQVGQYGSIFFDDGQGSFTSLTGLNYTGLLPITDTTPATTYTFNDFADDQSFSATDGPIVGGFQTIEFANTPMTPPATFETTDIANKNFVTFNTPGPSAGINGLVNIPVASDGLLTLTFNTPTGSDNKVTFLNTPPGVVTSLNTGTDEDVTNVNGPGVPIGTVLFLNGGGSSNTLNYDAGGEVAIVVPGLLPGEVLISIPGAGIVDVTNYQQININNSTVTSPPTVTPVDPLNSIEGFQLVNTEVGTFTFDLAGLFPIGTNLPAGLPASFFTATYDWGDGTTTAATITQDASDPSVYTVTGNHTYLDPGLYLTGLTVSFVGGPVTGTVNGVPVTLNLAPSTTTPAGVTTAVVTDGILAVTAFPIVGTEGLTIPSGAIASFIDAGGSDAIGAYSATISITGPNGFSLLVPAASIVQVGDSQQYTVIAPGITLPEAGTYQVQVTVTDSGQLGPFSATGTSVAVIADAPLSFTGPGVTLSLNTGAVPVAGYNLGIFTDANLGATEGDFTAVVDWGDGSPTSFAIVSSLGNPPGTFTVFAPHVYANPGSYLILVNVLDKDGATTVVSAVANVTDLAVTGATRNFTAVEGKDTGQFVLATFEDPNSLATVADVKAELAVGGWGDGTPGVAGVQLVVQQIGVNPVTGNPVFQVLGSHKYAEDTFPGLPNTLSVIITTSGGASTTLTSPPGGGVTVLDAELTGTNGNSITGVEGSPTVTTLLGTFTDANQSATVADFTTGAGSVVVDWGDGSLLETLGAGDLTAIGSPNGVIFTINAPHTYHEAGTYSYKVTVTDSGGSVTIVNGNANIADAALTAFAVGPFVGSTGVSLASNAVVGSFTDGNPFGTASDFTGVIDWGDGSATTLASFGGPPGNQFFVTGGHTYARPGVYTVRTNVLDKDGATVTLTSTYTITDLAVTGSTRNFTAEEGKDTGLFVLATFTDPNTFATVADVTAQLAVGGWGDGTPGVAGVTLIVQQIGVTPLTAAVNPGAPIFQVLGSHKYAEETFAGLPNTLSVIITTLGGATTTLTSPPGGGVTVLDAPLTSSNGTTITGTEGTSTGPKLLGTFTDANQGATVADFTTGGGTVVVDWGDGSPTQIIPAADITAVGSPNGVIFTVHASHTYAQAGVFAYNVTATDDGGATTIFSGTAIISAAPLTPTATQPVVNTIEAGIFPIPQFGKPVFYNQPVASFNAGNALATIGQFRATIDWGDGTPLSAGTITQPGGVGTPFIVTGSHTYADAGVNGGIGTYPMQIFVRSNSGATLTIKNTANVADRPEALTGMLNPQSDSGISNHDAITNVQQPDFFGQSEPFSHITLFATPVGGGPLIPLGQTQAQGDGAWHIVSGATLADGHYLITGNAVDQFGMTTTASPTTITPDLFIDTRGPVVTGAFFDRLNGRVNFRIQDPNPASGVFLASLLDSSNYEFTKVNARKNHPGQWVVTNVTATPDATFPDTYDVSVTFNGGAIIKGGFYLFRLRDSTSGPSSVRDIAGNHLDGEFYGNFPSGNGVNGGDFVAELQGYHNKIFAPQTIIGTANPGNNGVGGNPVAPVHSGVFVPVVPRGGSPIFSTSTSPTTTPTVPVKPAKKSSVFNLKAVRQQALAAAQASHAKQVVAVANTAHPKGPRHK